MYEQECFTKLSRFLAGYKNLVSESTQVFRSRLKEQWGVSPRESPSAMGEDGLAKRRVIQTVIGVICEARRVPGV